MFAMDMREIGRFLYLAETLLRLDVEVEVITLLTVNIRVVCRLLARY